MTSTLLVWGAVLLGWSGHVAQKLADLEESGAPTGRAYFCAYKFRLLWTLIAGFIIAAAWAGVGQLNVAGAVGAGFMGSQLVIAYAKRLENKAASP